jgi:hypothetical protein
LLFKMRFVVVAPGGGHTCAGSDPPPPPCVVLLICLRFRMRRNSRRCASAGNFFHDCTARPAAHVVNYSDVAAEPPDQLMAHQRAGCLYFHQSFNIFGLESSRVDPVVGWEHGVITKPCNRVTRSSIIQSRVGGNVALLYASAGATRRRRQSEAGRSAGHRRNKFHRNSQKVGHTTNE